MMGREGGTGKGEPAEYNDVSPLSPVHGSLFTRAALGFALAVSMLTILPFFRVHDFFKGINGYAVMFYPLVGALLGSLLWGIYLLGASYFPETHLRLILFFLWIVLTGALHLDGFADTVDGLFVPKERAEAVMKDPHVGGMGMIFTGAFLLLKASALWHLEALWALPLILMFSRFNAVLAIYFYPYIRPQGMSSLAKAEFTPVQLAAATFTVFAALLFVPQGGTLLAAALLVLLLTGAFFTRRLGGFSGDVYGFMIEVTEVVVLNLLLIGTAQ
jgi:adenosylcobinamide-GDP ribazoletransferase